MATSLLHFRALPDGSTLVIGQWLVVVNGDDYWWLKMVDNGSLTVLRLFLVFSDG